MDCFRTKKKYDNFQHRGINLNVEQGKATEYEQYVFKLT